MQMKSILIIDAPSNCEECACHLWKVCVPADEDIDEYVNPSKAKPDWCPLRHLPEWKDVPEYLETNRDWEAWGFDQCLTEILGDAEGETE